MVGGQVEILPLTHTTHLYWANIEYQVSTRFSREIVSSIEYTINTVKYHRASSSSILRVATPGVVSAVTSKFDGMITIIMCWHILKC